jgi:hypothetical protein
LHDWAFSNLFVSSYLICFVFVLHHLRLWVQLFILSKIPELIDTVFIVQRKRPLIFLHWYHHVTVLLYCWHSYATEASQALYFVAMNYSVHAVMCKLCLFPE